MVLDYYKLRDEPFGVTPDSRFLYASATHREALASVLYGVEARRGFVALIAKPGMGKTTLLFHALNRLREKARTVFLFQTISTPTDFLRALLADLGVAETQGGLIELQAKLNEVLAEQSRSGKPLVVVVDEAQNLNGAVLELVRMLSNFETSREKLLQIVLSGQPQLAEKLASPELVQLRQRVSIVAHLKPLSPKETALYIDHRLRAAGYSAEKPLFTRDALALIADCSEGIPRNINNLCFNALSLGCALERKTIDCDIVREVVADLDLEPLRERRSLAERPEKEEAREAPVFAAVAKPLSALAGGFAKVAVAGAIVLCLAGALFAVPHFRNVRSVQSDQTDQTDGSAVLEAAVQATHTIPPLVPIAPSSAGVDRSPQPVASAGTIRVTAGKTLYRICVENFGSCNPEHLQEIRGFNPWLSNPDHIEPGERIRISDQTDESAVLEAAVQTTHVIPPLVPIAPSSAGVDQSPQRVASAGTIRVTAGKTLYRICVENFGSCNPERLQEIRGLNPWLSNPDHIEPGERIRIPVVLHLPAVRQNPGATENLTAQAGSASPAEKGAQ